VDIYHPTYDNRKEFPSWENGQCTIEAIQGNSHDQAIVEKVREHGPFDWLFIDADHHYEAVLKDWDNYMPMVAPGGIVAFHDIVPHGQPDVQVSRLWSEIQRDQWRTVTIMEDAKSTTCGIGIVHKY
jgi:predicted O-methyltransferase YrrM